MKTRRVGQFVIDRRLIDDAPKQCLAILQGMIVVRAELLYQDDVFSYVAISEQFEELPAGATVPKYDYEIKDLVGGKYHVTWKRRP